MTNTQSKEKSQLLSDLPPYVYGTTRLGDGNIPFAERVRTARAAMEGTTWFHTSHAYGNALEVLRPAFDRDRTRVPKLIVKIGWQRTDELREVIHQNIDPLGLQCLELGQLCLSGSLAAEHIKPLPADIVEEIVKLHHRWSDEYDVKAELWSM